MNCFSNPKISSIHADILKQTQLGKLCGSSRLFRDRYEILKILGRGGFGITFLAKDAVLPGNPLCVIKLLCPKVTSSKSRERACKHFQKEAKILAQLGSHSQIPMLLDYFEINGEFYLVQEYVRGSNLAWKVKRNGPKNEVEVKQFLQEMLSVLQYVHKHHVIHRDIKPHNLLRSEDDKRLVLIDFGAVKEELLDVAESTMHESANTHFVGTMGFAPPEQLSLRPVYASDIYAVGVTCLYLLTAKSPLEFDQDSNTGECGWQTHVNLSEHFAQMLNKMLKISLEERFKSADEVIWALGMESYLPTLTNCLSTQRLRSDTKTTNKDISNQYLSPVARTANAIREWRVKLKTRNSNEQRKLHMS
ncbi:serine/threonine-protein kinase [Fischerella sp. PCC 9605]|uniref:serine/threonine-protein kinase n=1 Tax=Fischerella sp. PCC 9605 TaxID=1173024 RepID=UPI00047D40B3|nr:serine/threonine-protein kinase [Fischerella sp. PCC 9605]